MEWIRYWRQGGKGVWLLLLLLLGLVLVLVSVGKDDKTVVDDRIPTLSAKQALEKELAQMISAMEGVGAVRVSVSLHSGSEYVYENGKNTLVLAGRVRGVAVVCDGGADAVKRERIVSLLCALLDLPVRSVAVTQ